MSFKNKTTDYNSIEFTEYILPNGRKKKKYFIRPLDIVEKADKIIEKGYRFEMEKLRTGEISITIFDPKKTIDIDIRICSESNIIENVDNMISNFKIN